MNATLSPRTCPVCGATASRTEPKTQLSDEQWDLIAGFFPKYLPNPCGGRPPCSPRRCLEGILWLLRSGARWQDLPKEFPSPSTCWRRLQEWSLSGLFAEIWSALLQVLDDLGEIDWEEALADGTFARAKGGACVGNTKCGKGSKIMVLTDGQGLPLSAEVHSASPAEVTLIEDLIDHQKVEGTPEHLIYDRAADSDPLRERLKERGIDLVCPHRRSRKKPPTQDRRKLRRYKRRYRIERTHSWLQNFKRLICRMEHQVQNYVGLVQLACAMIVMRQFV